MKLALYQIIETGKEHKKMNIKNNISTFTQEFFQPLQNKNELESVSKVKNHTANAYNLDISISGMKSMEQFISDKIAIFNSDALTYTRDLRAINKAY